MHNHQPMPHGDEDESRIEDASTADFNYDISRRSFLRHGLRGGLTIGAAAGLSLALGGTRAEAQEAPLAAPPGGRPPRDNGGRRPRRRQGQVEAVFFGEHQSGIVTPPPTRVEFTTYDLVTADRADVVALFQRWTEAGSRITTGGTTVTFGLGPGFFDRLGVQSQRPRDLVMPSFAVDALVAAYTGGDIAVQVCAQSDAAAGAAAAEIEAVGDGVVAVRASQRGFRAATAPRETPRNLLGFRDGTVNPPFADGITADSVIWVGSEGPAWLQGGTYLAMRRIRLDIAAWEAMAVTAQEAVIGRDRETGAPLTGDAERDRPELRERDASGQLVIAADAHIRRARADRNGGARILRRGYNYRDSAEDAGLLFLSYQRDPAQFIRIQRSLAASDALNRFSTVLGSGLWAIPPGARSGGWLADGLLGA